MLIKEKKPRDSLDSLFQSNNEPSSLTEVNIDALLAEELERFERHRQIRSDVKRFGRLLTSSFYGELPELYLVSLPHLRR